MCAIAKVLLGLLFAFSLIRAVLYATYVFYVISFPYDAHMLESAMVHYAWRVQHGVMLYPEWRNYPYVANFYAPLNFVLIGVLGRAAGADIAGLYGIGRGVTVVSVLMTTAVLGLVMYRKYGRLTAWFGMLVSLGVGPLFGAGLSTRPDGLAELFGLTGFFLATSRKPVLVVAGACALYLGAMTKQPTLIYMLAAVIGLAVEFRFKAATLLCIGVLSAVLVTVWAVGVWLEPNFTRSLLGESQTPKDFESWWQTVAQTATNAPEFLVLTATGIVLWTTRPQREPRLIALAVLLLAAGLYTCAKRGSAENYFLGLRAIAALAAVGLWRELAAPERCPRLGHLLAAAATVVGLAHSTRLAEAYVHTSIEYVNIGKTPSFQENARSSEQFLHAAQDPKRHVLTDVGIIDIYQGDRALFADPYRFKLMVESNQIDPKKACTMIDNNYYDIIVSEHDIFAPKYAHYDFGFPGVLVAHARMHYEPEGKLHGLYLYMRRDQPSRP